ncbi:MAG: hypothetical protein NTX64_09785 [Elusimicrobia bacterium]|nr:hypothetical protein [Elusimicrobiota bacterium]
MQTAAFLLALSVAAPARAEEPPAASTAAAAAVDPGPAVKPGPEAGQPASLLRPWQGFPWRMAGSMSVNWRNVGPRRPQYETQIQNQLYLADMYFAFLGPALDGVPFRMEFQMPTGGQGSISLYQLYFEYKRLENWDIHVGKFLVPFGRYNELYRPDMFLTVTRPLLYASPDSLDLVVRIDSPRPPFSSGYSDIGARTSYYPPRDRWWAPSEMTVFVVNGFSESSNRSRAFPSPSNLGIPAPPANGVSMDFGHENNNLADNNNNKAFGGRLVYSMGTLDLPWPIPEGKRDLTGVSVGFSAMNGWYDLEANENYHMIGVDLSFEYQGANVSAEYVYSPQQLKSPLLPISLSTATATPLVGDLETFQGYFLQASYPIARHPRIGKRVTGVVVWNQLFRRGPQLTHLDNTTINGTFFTSAAAASAGAPRLSTRMDKLTFGVDYQFSDHFSVKGEYSYWFMGRATTDVGGIDIYQGALSVVASF